MKKEKGETVWRIIHLRWDIENNGMNELKNSWNLNYCYDHDVTAIEAIILILLVVVNLFTLFVAYSTWHELKWDYTSGTKADMYIDNTLVASPTGITSFNKIEMGNWWGSPFDGVTYFDDILVGDN